MDRRVHTRHVELQEKCLQPPYWFTGFGFDVVNKSLQMFDVRRFDVLQAPQQDLVLGPCLAKF